MENENCFKAAMLTLSMLGLLGIFGSGIGLTLRYVGGEGTSFYHPHYGNQTTRHRHKTGYDDDTQSVLSGSDDHVPLLTIAGSSLFSERAQGAADHDSVFDLEEIVVPQF